MEEIDFKDYKTARNSRCVECLYKVIEIAGNEIEKNEEIAAYVMPSPAPGNMDLERIRQENIELLQCEVIVMSRI